ncbi:anti-sigma factor [Litoreibacter janthinus]|uniref:Anti-sigma-K factor RskA n=1 Tax=Litoreibacter janthinus TaxID=670154 RepID=A0A1I6GCF5_9RHOB|nr:anti-sigma factor [Litoreibacter janthinus]SFR39757.1 Anti-sigma-K factor RskA [Litoreibacter janthinus]
MTDDLTPEEESRALAAEYVLRLMSPEDERAFESRLAEDRDLENDVAEWVAHFEPLADEFASVAPPKALKARLTADLFGAPEKPASIWARLGLWQGISLTATAAAAVMAVMLVIQPVPEVPTAGQMFVSEIAAEDDSLRVLAVYDSATGDLRLTRTAGQAAGGRDFELWAIVGDNAPVSLGVLTDDESSEIELPEALRASLGEAVLAISDEPDGGSTTGAPTGAVLAVGQVSEV